MPIVELTTDAARRYGDLRSILADLDTVAAACGRLRELMSREGADTLVEGALWSLAVTRYARCFASGARARLTVEDVAPIDPGASEFHRTLVTIRDKHLAHRVGSLEQVSVGAILSSEFGTNPPPEVVGVAHIHAAHVVPEADGVSGLELLATRLRDIVESRAATEQNRVLDEARTRTLDQLESSPRLQFTVPTPEQFGTRHDRMPRTPGVLVRDPTPEQLRQFPSVWKCPHNNRRRIIHLGVVRELCRECEAVAVWPPRVEQVPTINGQPMQ